MARHFRERTGDAQRPFYRNKVPKGSQKAYLREMLYPLRNNILIKINISNLCVRPVGRFLVIFRSPALDCVG